MGVQEGHGPRLFITRKKPRSEKKITKLGKNCQIRSLLRSSVSQSLKPPLARKLSLEAIEFHWNEYDEPTIRKKAPFKKGFFGNKQNSKGVVLPSGLL